MFHFQSDSATRTGLTLFVLYDDYPAVIYPAHLAAPLRYLTTRREYEEISSAQEVKPAVDRFWLSLAGSYERGRELIKKYYTRVQDANRYFTSYAEGWQTDRGIIYVVFGAPNVIYKTSNSESWIYGESGSITSLNFTFVRVENPFTDNDYLLNRSPIYENVWFHAVEAWRQGRIYE